MILCIVAFIFTIQVNGLLFPIIVFFYFCKELSSLVNIVVMIIHLLFLYTMKVHFFLHISNS